MGAATAGEESRLERAINGPVSAAIHLFLSLLAVLLFAAAVIATVVIVWMEFPTLWRTSEEYTALQSLIQHILLVAIAAELALLLLFHRTGAAVDVVIFVIARKLVSPELTGLDVLLGVIGLAALIAVRSYFLSGKSRAAAETTP